MAFPDQIEKLVTRLTELTGRGKVEWQETANLNTYLAPVGKFTVTLGKAGSEVYGGYNFQILDQTGRVIDGASHLCWPRKERCTVSKLGTLAQPA